MNLWMEAAGVRRDPEDHPFEASPSLNNNEKAIVVLGAHLIPFCLSLTEQPQETACNQEEQRYG